MIPIEIGSLYCSETLIMGFDEIFLQEKQVVQLRFLVYERLCRYFRCLFSANFFFHFITYVVVVIVVVVVILF